jgi:hypothetical protein
MARHGLWQRLAIDQFHQLPGGIHDPAGVIALAELRHHVFLDHPAGGDVGDRAFEPIADFDAHLAVVLGHDQQQAVIDALAAELERLERAHRVFLDGLRRGAGDHQHLQLAALALLQGQRLLFELLAGRGLQRTGGVHHRRVEGGDGGLLCAGPPGQA